MAGVKRSHCRHQGHPGAGRVPGGGPAPNGVNGLVDWGHGRLTWRGCL
jgi:hypothetical protein